MIPKRFSPEWFTHENIPYTKLLQKSVSIQIVGENDIITPYGVDPQLVDLLQSPCTKFLGRRVQLHKGIGIDSSAFTLTILDTEDSDSKYVRIPFRAIKAFKLLNGQVIDLQHIQRILGLNHLESGMWVLTPKHGWCEIKYANYPLSVRNTNFAECDFELTSDDVKSITAVENILPYHALTKNMDVSYCGQWHGIESIQANGRLTIKTHGENFVKKIMYCDVSHVRYTPPKNGFGEPVKSLSHITEAQFKAIKPGQWVKTCLTSDILARLENKRKEADGIHGIYKYQKYYPDKFRLCDRWVRVTKTDHIRECIYTHQHLKTGGYAFHYTLIQGVSDTAPIVGESIPAVDMSGKVDFEMIQNPIVEIVTDFKQIEDSIIAATGIPKEYFEKNERRETMKVSDESITEVQTFAEENLASAKGFVDANLALVEQKKAAAVYQGLLDEKNELERTIKQAQDRLAVVNKGLEPFESAVTKVRKKHEKITK